MASAQTPASKVFFAVSMSLDGYIAPAGMDLEHADDPSYKDWGRQWAALQSWVFPQRVFRQRLKLGEGGETGPDNDGSREIFERTGVSILGKRMFEGGERVWPEEAPFHTPVFVVTHTERAPWQRAGGTTFHFVNEGIEDALARARTVGGGQDIRIGGGADLVRQYINAGLVNRLAQYFHRAPSPRRGHSAIRLHRVRAARPGGGRHRPLAASDPPQVCSQRRVAPRSPTRARPAGRRIQPAREHREYPQCSQLSKALPGPMLSRMCSRR